MTTEPRLSSQPTEAALPEPFATWFARRGWEPHPHQLDLLARAADPATLLIAPTGGGKTLAGFLPSLIELGPDPPPGLHTLYVSPLKALAADIRRNLGAPRRRDGPEHPRRGPHRRHRRRPARPPARRPAAHPADHARVARPHALLRGGAENLRRPRPASSSTRSTRLPNRSAATSSMLGLARLQTLAPDLRRVGLSATVEDPPALAAFLGDARVLMADPGPEPDISILETEEPPPWAGQTATYAARAVMDLIRAATTTLVFINTRAQAEVFFQHLWAENSEGLPVGLHHGSLSRESRARVEAAMVAGELRGIVATGSLDLGIDWGDVDLVIQVGAPKNVKRLVQRIGRANHRYNAPSRAVLVPSNRFEVLECRAALDAVHEHDPRRRAARPRPARRPLPAHPAHRLRRPLRRRRALRRGPRRRPLPRPAARRLRRLPRLLRHRRLRAPRLRPLAAPRRCATAAGSCATRAAPAPSG